MFYSVDGRVITVNNNFIERRENTLTFEVDGTTFPNPSYLPDRSKFIFRSITPNTLTINYADGNVVTKPFVLSSGEYYMEIRYDTLDDTIAGIIPRHTYSDGEILSRLVSFEFENMQEIEYLNVTDSLLERRLPSEINSMKKLIQISLTRTQNLTELDLDFPPNINAILFADIGSIEFNKLPDSIFNLPLEVLYLTGIINILDNTAGNFFKINQLSGTLRGLRLSSTQNLPPELEECKNITSLLLKINTSNFQSILNQLPNLTDLNISSDIVGQFYLTSFSNLFKLSKLALGYNKIMNFYDIPVLWENLKSLATITGQNSMTNTSEEFDEFSNAFYDLCTVNGYLDPVSAPLEEEYPSQFRNISWGNSKIVQSNTPTEPAGFILGVDNGSPVNVGEKIYVLIHNYGHTVVL